MLIQHMMILNLLYLISSASEQNKSSLQGVRQYVDEHKFLSNWQTVEHEVGFFLVLEINMIGAGFGKHWGVCIPKHIKNWEKETESTSNSTKDPVTDLYA